MNLSVNKRLSLSGLWSLVLLLSLSGCVSNDKEIDIVIPPPSSSFSEKQSDNQVTVSFRQSNGQVMTKTVEVEGSYTGGEDASPAEVRKKAIQAMINRAVDLVNGQLISNSIDIRQATYGNGTIEETKQNVISQTVGLGRLLEEPECQLSRSSSITTTMVCKGSVSVPLIEEFKVLRSAQ